MVVGASRGDVFVVVVIVVFVLSLHAGVWIFLSVLASSPTDRPTQGLIIPNRNGLTIKGIDTVR